MTSSEPIRIFVGRDRRENVVNWVFQQSVLNHTSLPVTFQDISLPVLENLGVWWRERLPTQSTDFSFARFMVPWLCNYEGWALFVDGDMLCRDDLAKLWALRDDRYTVRVVKHVDYVPIEDTKFLGQPQMRYDRKNWSSVMLFNCRDCEKLTPEYVNDTLAADLHGLSWAYDNCIGPLPRRYNHLVGVYGYDPDAAIVHFTTGAPAFKEYQSCDYADEWRAVREVLNYCEQKDDNKSGIRNPDSE